MARTRLAMGLVLLLLLNFSNFVTHVDESIASENFDDPFSPIALEPDPDSIRGVSPSSFNDIEIAHRSPGANTPVGSLSTTGWTMSDDVSSTFVTPRTDLSIVLIDSGIDPWEARESLNSIDSLNVKTMIPPTGFLIQGNEDGLEKAESIEGVIASSTVPIALVVDSPVREAINSMNPEDPVTSI